MSGQQAPSPYPCASCPYRQDVPSGVWSEEEYVKLPRYDNDLWAQPVAAFMCHQDNGRLCSGWVGCHNMDENLGLRMATNAGLIDRESVEAALDYTSPVPLFSSGAEAAAHGRAKITQPDNDARRVISKLERRRERRG